MAWDGAEVRGIKDWVGTKFRGAKQGLKEIVCLQDFLFAYLLINKHKQTAHKRSIYEQVNESYGTALCDKCHCRILVFAGVTGC